jgi:hypothetical protein
MNIKHSTKPKTDVVPVMVRIRPVAKQLLVQAATDQRRSQASIVDMLIMEGLSRQYATTDQRLSALLTRRFNDE